MQVLSRGFFPIFYSLSKGIKDLSVSFDLNKHILTNKNVGKKGSRRIVVRENPQ